MNALANLPRILLIDSNVYFAKRVGEALQQVGFEVVPCTQAAYALTMLEWNAPAAILCATNLREMGALEMAPILRADANSAHIPLIAIGGGGAGAGDQALLEAYRAGCDDFVDRRRSPSQSPPCSLLHVCLPATPSASSQSQDVCRRLTGTPSNDARSALSALARIATPTLLNRRNRASPTSARPGWFR